MHIDELTAWLRLGLTEGIGHDTARRLLAHFGSPAAVFEQSAFTLRDVVSAAQADALCSPPLTLATQVAHTQHWLQLSRDSVQHAVWPLGDAAYPQALLDASDPPLLLYAQGQLDAGLPPAVAVVGSRNPTPQGAQTAEQLGQALVEAGLCVVSGLALGIDGAAHRGALQAASSDGVATVAVVGTGLDRVYPRQHQALAQAIAAKGWLLSEYPLGTPPLAHHFPQRNRLIAALGRGTLVVEAALRSGSLITADLALGMGRDVMAVPGSIHAPQSRGCHALIRQGAKLIETAQDVLEEWPDIFHNALSRRSGHVAVHLVASSSPAVVTIRDDTTDPLLSAMGHAPVSLEVLQARTGWDTSRLLSALLTLELEGSVARMPGGLYQRLGPR